VARTSHVRAFEKERHMHNSTFAAWLAVASLSLACANAPTKELGEAEAAYRAAQELGAAESPVAAYHLKLAEDQIAQAKTQMDGDETDRRRARRMLQRAELDAEVAITVSRTSAAESRAREAWIEVQELREQAPVGAPEPNTEGR
jgi:hypothetical protein